MSSRPSEFVLKAFPRAVIVVVALVAMIPALASLTGNDDLAALLGGDFSSFYAAGEIVLDGRIDELYDPQVQAEYQVAYSERDDGFLYFAYPPLTAVAYALLALMPYGMALTVHALASLAAVVGAMLVMVPRIDASLRRRDHVIAGTALALLVLPLAIAVLGGQNSAYTLLLVSLVWWSASSGRSVAAGVAAGLLLFKPQFGIPVIVLLVVARQWRAALTSGAVAVVGFSATTALLGLGWVGAWVDQVRSFGEQNADTNGDLMVNVTGWVANAFGDGAGVVSFTILLWAAIAVVTVVVAWRVGIDWAAFGLCTTAIMLLSPSTLFYDAGVAIVAFCLWAAADRRMWWWVAGAVVASWTAPLGTALGWSPLFIVLLALFAFQVPWIVRSMRRPESVSQAPGTLAAPSDSEWRRESWRVIRSS